MSQIIKIKNDTLTTQTWAGKEFTAAEEHTIDESNLLKWKHNSTLITAIANSEALVGDGTTYFSDVNQALDWLKGNVPTHLADPFPDNESGYYFRGSGGSFTTAVGANNVDIKLHATEDRCINGAEVWTDTGLFGDYLTFEVVDVDNVLGAGAGYVVDSFGTGWQIHASLITKAFPGYIANVPAGLYVRMKVTAAVACEFYFNLHLHEIT
jgi:hypothetical protein